MNLYELASRVIEALEAETIPYMVVGALSSSVFGIPRATKDVLAVQTPDRLDMAYITRWCELHQTSGHLRTMLAEIEPLL